MQDTQASDDAGGEPPDWHSLPPEDVIRRLAGSRQGLDAATAGERLGRHGPNRLPPAKRVGPLFRFLRQFDNVLIYVLLVASLVSAGLGHWIDAGVIMAVVVINAIIGFAQESRAEAALAAIESMLAPEARVRREGRQQILPAEQLVPGDIVLLQSGDRVPADIRLIEVRNLHVDEAALTGESLAVEKATDAVTEDRSLPDRKSMAYAGTLVHQGKAEGIVVATGALTEIGRVGKLLENVDRLVTPLLRQIAVFARWLTLGILLLAVATFFFGVFYRQMDLSETFMAAVGLAVAAIPEGLPAILTITLALGMARMARHRAIVRHLPAVETLGSVTVICSDKTGTLTRNELVVQSLAASRLDLRGQALTDGARDHEEVRSILGGFALCNDAMVSVDGRRVSGNATDGALLDAAGLAGLDVASLRREHARLDSIPFESLHKYMATLHGAGERACFALVKGAPERILEMCEADLSAGERLPIDRAAWISRIDKMAAQGERVLALARFDWPEERRQLRAQDLAQGDGAMLGLVGFIDPPREEAIAAVATCRSAGIKVKMITGDHLATARAIGARFGLGEGGRVVNGPDLDRMDEAAFRQAARECEIFARATPEHKLRLVKALQRDGEVVGMTGDGVNDSPALKRADIGIAMGMKGTEAAKEASDMVLTDDNFATIVTAVRSGRAIYDNLRKSIVMILPTSAGEAMVVMAAIVMGFALPITPVQILWVNMATAVTLGLALAFERAEKDIMLRLPRAPETPILTPFLVWRLVLVSALLFAATFGLFARAIGLGEDLALARTLAVNTLVAGEIAYLFNCRHLLRASWTAEGFFGSLAVWLAILLVIAAQAAFTYLPLMQTLFGTVPLAPRHWLLVGTAAVLIFLAVELEKLAIRAILARRPRPAPL